MANNYTDNLGEEVRKGMIEKARQGHWPTVAPVGYQNNRSTHRIEPDAERAPLVVKLFEWYASGEYSLKALTRKAAAVGLTNRTGGSPLVKAKIHQLLHNPIIKPFDVFARGSETGDWLLGLDDFRNWLIQEAA